MVSPLGPQPQYCAFLGSENISKALIRKPAIDRRLGRFSADVGDGGGKVVAVDDGGGVAFVASGAGRSSFGGAGEGGFIIIKSP
mmetsp:Transcript_22929/g.45717  ORF Transcript_22929/g.45717 Transcript_22929/m.45717 type:complete len:84 (-) Transcript_22929:139-390(-)